MGAHPCVIQLLDALVVDNQVQIVYPLWDQHLSQFLAQRKARPPARGSREECTHIFSCLLAGALHMHTHCTCAHTCAHYSIILEVAKEA